MTQQGIENDILILESPDCLPVLLKLLEGYNTIAATSTSCEFDRLNHLIGKVKEFEHKEITYILGGSHATTTNEQGNFDEICVGEYGGYAENLDELPDYLLGKLPLPDILKANSGWLCTIVSRGCPYACAYCINSLSKRKPRRMSVDKAIGHIGHIVNSLEGVKVVNFDDDNLANDKAWLESFLTRFKARINLPYVINVRATDIDDSLTGLLKRTGCHEVQIGVECGDELIRYDVLNKHISDAAIINAFDRCHRAGLRTLAYIMHGIPFTFGDIAEGSAKLIRRIRPTLIRDTYFYPWRGSRLYNQLTTNGREIVNPELNYFDASFLSGEDGEKQRFRNLLSDMYRPCKRNEKYLEIMLDKKPSK
jgi:radical SAM superfamily enzyme YgiQ (UPF0313 family)